MTLSYRGSLSGRIRAAYLKNVRVGYVEQRVFGRWVWQLIFVAPDPAVSGYHGVCDDETAAVEHLEQCMYHWLVEAGLLDDPLPVKERVARDAAKIVRRRK